MGCVLTWGRGKMAQSCMLSLVQSVLVQSVLPYSRDRILGDLAEPFVRTGITMGSGRLSHTPLNPSRWVNIST